MKYAKTCVFFFGKWWGNGCPRGWLRLSRSGFWKRKRLAVSAASKLVGGTATSKITTFWWKREKAEVVAMDVALKSTASKHWSRPWLRPLNCRLRPSRGWFKPPSGWLRPQGRGTCIRKYGRTSVQIPPMFYRTLSFLGLKPMFAAFMPLSD